MRDEILVDLALQGGGAHGAFTWGVLERLIEEPWLRIDGVSGTSAGAMNAAALIHGFSQSSVEGARAAMEEFWRRVAAAARFSPLRSAARWMCCSAAGRSTIHRPFWRWTFPRV